jgi:SAM-dependent methyltransferase
MSMNATRSISVAKPVEPSIASSLDLGRPQREIHRLMAEGALAGEVLDLGCGRGEHALMLAASGIAATGVDDSPSAIARAEREARTRNLDGAQFVVGDLLRLGAALGDRTFDAAVDAGTLHRFSADARAAYARSVKKVLRPGAKLYVLVFGEHERGHGGPARITQAELQAAFAEGFTVERIADARFESHIFPGGAHGWLATLTRR